MYFFRCKFRYLENATSNSTLAQARALLQDQEVGAEGREAGGERQGDRSLGLREGEEEEGTRAHQEADPDQGGGGDPDQGQGRV